MSHGKCDAGKKKMRESLKQSTISLTETNNIPVMLGGRSVKTVSGLCEIIIIKFYSVLNVVEAIRMKVTL